MDSRIQEFEYLRGELRYFVKEARIKDAVIRQLTRKKTDSLPEYIYIHPYDLGEILHKVSQISVSFMEPKYTADGDEYIEICDVKYIQTTSIPPQSERYR